MRGPLFASLILTLTILGVLAHLVANDRVSISVYPHVVMAGGAVRVTCKVPRSADNRGLFYGLTNYTSSFKQLDGDASRVTWEEIYTHIPCEVTGAFCDLRSDRAKPDVVTLPVSVAGCH